MTAPLSIEPGTLPLSSLNDDPRDIMIIKQTDVLVGIKWNSRGVSVPALDLDWGRGGGWNASASAIAIATCRTLLEHAQFTQLHQRVQYSLDHFDHVAVQ